MIDTLAYQFIDDWQFNDKSYSYYAVMCKDFFRFMATGDRTQQYWRAPGSSQYVFRKGPFEWKASRCYNLAIEAIVYEISSQEWSAKQKWRDIFGTSFPG